MKRQVLKSFITLCAAVMAVCAASFVTSCDKYDDGPLKEEIVALKDRVTKLEKDLGEQVKALQALSALQEAADILIGTNKTNIEANAAKLNELLAALNGFKGESTLTLEQIQKTLTDLANADTDLAGALAELGAGIVDYSYNEATGIATVVLSNGQSLQVVVRDNTVDAVGKKADDGKYYWAVGGKFLEDAEGNKIPVSVTPKVKLDPETNKVRISADGGLTWVETDIVDEPAFFKAVDKDEDYVYFTLADGSEIKLARSNSAISITIPVMKMFVDYGQTKTVDIVMNNVEKFVIVKPEGWRASIKSGKLTVTAPAQGVGEEEGQIQIFAVGSDGRSAIYEVKVVAGPAPIAIEVNSETDLFSITPKSATTKYLFGVDVMDESTTIESIFKSHSTGFEAADVMTGNQVDKKFAEEFAVGTKYVVWAIMLDENGNVGDQTYADMFYQTYQKNLRITVSDITSLDANVKIETAGDYYYYIQPLAYNFAKFTEAEQKQQIDAQIKSATSTSDLMSDGKYAESANSLLNWYKKYYSSTAVLIPGYTIFVALLPADNKSADAVVYKLVTLEDYKLGNMADDAIKWGTPTETYKTVSVRITPSTGVCFRFNYMTLEDFIENYEGDETAQMKFAVGDAKASGEKKTAQTASPYPLKLGESYVVVVYAYNPSTAVGRVFTKQVNCPAITYNEAISLNLDVTYTGANYVEATITPSAAIKSIRYGYMKKADFEKNATLKANGTELEKMMAIAREQLAIDNTISKRANFDKDNLAADHKYTIENLYLMEEQYLIVIAFDANDKVTGMAYELIDTKTPFENGFDASLPKPTVNNVYYNTSSTGYQQPLDKWVNMNTVTDVTTLDELNGMYWLDLTWSSNEMKRMWLCSDNANSTNLKLLTGEAKHDAIEVLKARAGYLGTGVAPDFYGRAPKTGAPTLSNVKMWNTSYLKTLRDKIVKPYGPKTIHLVWETTNGKYGYMTVVPETYANPTTPDPDPEVPDTPDTPATGDLASSPWGHAWVWMHDEKQEVFGVLDLCNTAASKIQLGYGKIVDGTLECTGNALPVSGSPEAKIAADGSTYVEFNEEYRLYWSAGSAPGEAVIWSPGGEDAYSGLGIETRTTMRSAELMGVKISWKNNGPSIGNN